MNALWNLSYYWLAVLFVSSPCLVLATAGGDECASAILTPKMYLHDAYDGQDNATMNPNTTSTINNMTDGIVWELGYDNFESVIGSSHFTFVLTYDRMDVAITKQRSLILEKLAESFASMKQPSSIIFRNLKLAFAKLDKRRHSYIHHIYGTYRAEKSYLNYYEKELSSTNFFRENIYFSSSWSLFYGGNYNVIDFAYENPNDDPDSLDDHVKQLRRWLIWKIRDNIQYATEGIGQPILPFHKSHRGPRAVRMSKPFKEMNDKEKSVEKDNSFDFSSYKDSIESNINATERKLSPDLLSFHVKQDDESGDKFYKYRNEEPVDRLPSHDLFSLFMGALQRYLVWAEAYEVLWDNERKRKADEQTNYGYYLDRMNAQIKDTLFSMYDDLADEGFLDFYVVPDLQQYYIEIMFGYFRSPATLSKYLQRELFDKLEIQESATALNITQVSEIAMVECIRDMMVVMEACKADKERYEMYFKTMQIKVNAILTEFQENLTRHYLSYRKANPSLGDDFKFKSLEVLDMQDPANHGLLSSYDEFESRYTAQGIPVVLSNVNMTDETFTLEYLVERCGFMDVTNKLFLSHSVGDSRVDTWGGLTDFVLPRELITKNRILDRKEGAQTYEANEYQHNRNGDPEDDYDKSLTFEQFVNLSKWIKNLYLHDFNLRHGCDRLFYDKTPYDAEQHFRIPAVIGQYDIFQKVAFSGFQFSWPSLFVGLKGSNSKLHVDTAATGFFMYLVSGRKRWIVFEHSTRPFLYERINEDSFIADVLALNKDNATNARMDESYPLLRPGMEGGYEFIQEAGQLVYVPPNSPHAVENLEDIVGISMNFGPRAGVANHLHNLATDGRPAFKDIEIVLRYLMFEGGRDTLAQTNDPLYATMGEYEAQL